MVKIISLDGNIGSGKSTILDALAKKGYRVFKEGVDRWSDVLELFYTNKSRWGFTLQVAILYDMYDLHNQAISCNEECVFFERSPVSSLIFVKNSYENNDISDIEYKHYMKLHKILSWTPDETFYLNTPYDLCYYRIINRSDPSIYTGLSKDYVQKIEVQYLKHQNQCIDGSLPVDQIVNILLNKCCLA